MRASKTMSAIVALFVVAAASAQEPANVDALLDKLAAAQKQRIEVAKTINDLTGEIQNRLLALNKRLAEINGAPLPMPPAPPPANDPLKEKVAKAFAADAGTAAEKNADAVKLWAVYAAAVEQKTADDASLKTSGQLIERVRSISPPPEPGKLTETRKVIAAEIAAVLKNADVALEAWDEKKQQFENGGVIRKSATALFVRIAAALDEVTK